MVRRLPPLFLVVLILALLPVPAGAQSAPGPAKGAGDAAPEVKTLLKTAGKLERQVSRLRGLGRRRAIRKAVMSRPELEKLLRTKLAEQYSDAEILAESALWQRMGLLPAGYDYKGALITLLLEQVAGFYDPKQRKLYLADWIPLALQRPALAHEICHALQDQHFNLRRLVKPLRDNTDRQLARMALVEGDCTGVMMEYMLAPMGLDLGSLGDKLEAMMGQAVAVGGGGKAFAAAPPLLRQSLLFPYIQGLLFVQKIRTRHPWSVVNRLYRRPPRTTEQVLHYDKYWSREGPRSIRPRPLPLLQERGFQRVRQDVAGELVLSLYLRGFGAVGEDAARRAAEGWAGDLLLAFAPPKAGDEAAEDAGEGKGEGQGAGASKGEGKVEGAGKGKGSEPPDLQQMVLIHLSSWDSAADAVEYENAQARLFEARGLSRVEPAQTEAGDKATAEKAPLRLYRDAEGRLWSQRRHRGHIVSLLGVPAELHPELERQVWLSTRIGGRIVAPPQVRRAAKK